MSFFQDLSLHEGVGPIASTSIEKIMSIPWQFAFNEPSCRVLTAFQEGSQVRQLDGLVEVVTPDGYVFQFIPLSVKPNSGRYVFRVNVNDPNNRQVYVVKFLSGGLLSTNPEAQFEVLKENLKTLNSVESGIFPQVYALGITSDYVITNLGGGRDDQVTLPVLMVTEYVGGITLQ